MAKNQFWIALGLAVTFGFGLQVLKSPSPERARLAGFSRLSNMLDEGGAVYDPNAKADARISGDPSDAIEDERDDVGGIGSRTLLAANEAGPAANAAPEATGSPTPAKKDDKKKNAKKKDAKKTDKKKPEEKPAEKPPEGEKPPAAADEKKPDDPAPGAMAGLGDPVPTPTPSATPTTATGNLDTIPRSAAEWESYLMSSPSMERTQQFIRYYQVGLVTSAVYYQVIQAMLTDHRPEMQRMGVLALGATPNTQSFQMLVSVEHGSEAADSKAQAQTYLRVYARPENLHYLTAVLSSTTATNATAAYESILLVQVSAQTYLRQAKLTQSPGPFGTAGTVSPTALTGTFTTVLKSLVAAEKWPNQQVSAAATQTAQTLQSMLANLPTVTAQGGTTPGGQPPAPAPPTQVPTFNFTK